MQIKNEQVKVYIGRRSVCAADDVNAPNPATFYLPDTLDEFVTVMNKMLPFRTWKCYLGEGHKNISDVEDGIIVWGKADNQVLISVGYETHDDAYKRIRAIVKNDSDWHEKIKAHPYLYCE